MTLISERAVSASELSEVLSEASRTQITVNPHAMSLASEFALTNFENRSHPDICFSTQPVVLDRPQRRGSQYLDRRLQLPIYPRGIGNEPHAFSREHLEAVDRKHFIAEHDRSLRVCRKTDPRQHRESNGKQRTHQPPVENLHRLPVADPMPPHTPKNIHFFATFRD